MLLTRTLTPTLTLILVLTLTLILTLTLPNPIPTPTPNPHRVEVVDVAAAALASDASSEEPAVVVKVVDTAAARSAVVRPCLAHAHIAVRRQAGALELARAAPPYAAAHAVRAQLLVLQVLEPLERLAALQPLGDHLRQRQEVLRTALHDAGVAIQDAQPEVATHTVRSRLVCVASTYSAHKAGTRGPYVQNGGPGTHVSA